MPSAEFSQSLQVRSSLEDCWNVITDAQQVAGWVSVVNTVVEVEPLETYTAVLEDSFGPFKLHADIKVQVTELVDRKSIRFEGNGQDRTVGTTIGVDARMELEPSESGTVIRVEGKYQVLGSVATMGGSTIRKKADTIIEEFFAAVDKALG
jgi:carbon monoxide dehydrogenase subunit G